MNKDQAKKLMEIESCINYLCDQFLEEAVKLPNSTVREKVIEGMKEVIGINLTEVMYPIYSAHPSLNPHAKNSISYEWYKNTRVKTFKKALENVSKSNT